MGGAARSSARRTEEKRSLGGRANEALDCAAGARCVYYAALYLFADEPTEAVIWLGTDDGFRLYLNGEEVLESHHHNFQEKRVPLSFEAGRNLLLVNIENTTYYCKLKARLTDLQHKPQRLVRASIRRRLQD
ncbi:MAG: hypothetical protein ACYSUN_15080 [Planctomycetota bacterium]|jgi:hypothetical protein